MAIISEHNGHKRTVLCIIKDGKLVKEVFEGDRLVFENQPLSSRNTPTETTMHLIPGYYEIMIVGGGGGSVASGGGGDYAHPNIYVNAVGGE